VLTSAGLAKCLCLVREPLRLVTLLLMLLHYLLKWSSQTLSPADAAISFLNMSRQFPLANTRNWHLAN